ncbi:hypothetical protein G6F55_010047 [Rhizopus delemar]|uniref:protein-tyrosine-phosphatase n=2 Tax=Rhizopus TaxID=4842 RepID=A0A9P7CIN2_9FUNG|nr:hypothetical protein G6F55_010047 [Rhizopus delemar]KAG1520126.1 hypothetical protein G6F52_007963 [Rhizopus delemar]KAG1536573.1 hypothetical protein G6F51_010894 [Rhizopus arrhizus]KAG1564011.1 hypothetical protein G6F50_011439 [Rhizopus delemar]KAG1631510.1 hypothetical protein G6F45_004758 [Rhizopus arrhizus]
MSVTYQSPTYHWSSENEHNVISYSANSETNSPPTKQHPLSQPPQEFINALQKKGHCLNPTTTHHYHQSQHSILEPIVNHDLSRLLNITQPLLIDVRSAFHYSENHIKSAIHIAIPSVLLKRPAYTLDKVIQSLNGSDADRFKQWPATTHIIFYDHTSNNDSGYSATAILLALKLKQVHYQGHLAYLQGGFDQFKKFYPNQCIHTRPASQGDASSNSFFTNIRQNLELSHGPLKERFAIRTPSGKEHKNGMIQLSPTHHPRYGLGGSSADKLGNFELPVWLREMMNKESGPKKLAENYEQLERTEQERLQFVMKYHSSHKSTVFPLSISSSMEKGTLNRYNNIWPYEYSRVKLSDKKDDYINASYIQYAVVKNDAALCPVSPLSDLEQDLVLSGLLSQESLETKRHPERLQKSRKYIATQGPLPTTFSDFWKMVWDEDSHVVVMLTNEEELNKIKCHRYWPSTAHSSQNHGSITVTLLSEHMQPVINMNDKRERGDSEYIIIRRFQLKHRSSLLSNRTITHLQYTGWSDFGVPDHPMGLLQLIHLADEAYKVDHGQRGPVTVHCSAGCGRTGAFCVVDTVIERLWQERDVYTSSAVDKIKETVERFREQRISIVQTHRQYVFCYEAILWWLLGYGHLPTMASSDLCLDDADVLANEEDSDEMSSINNDVLNNLEGL